ncbi:hypothetical protein SeMB42_g03870 [Synchytrium endobioticum]|uniref:Uncharacterized protein n=1 Tax=Synchytrium endobioticum TaxID=286115 RepID=A0A507D3Q0_9FUNG|nr:hypothetical protein SeMB42_g03870 [Synchytrium endobioticum]
MPDSILLPDGKVLYVNGAGYGFAGGAAGWGTAYNPRYQADIFNPSGPVGSRFSTLASASVDRIYHSTAMLIQDGRVVTAGSEEQNWNDINRFGPSRADPSFANCTIGLAAGAPGNRCTDPFEYRMEAFAPPYLFKGNRPVIVSAPTSLTYNSTFLVGVTGGVIQSFSFIRYTTVTHSTNADQRFWESPIIGRNDTGYLVRAPTNPNVAAPGNWMLFAQLPFAGSHIPNVAVQSSLPTQNPSIVFVIHL